MLAQDLDTARLIFEKAVKVNFRSVDDLASIWCEYAEFEIRHKQYAKVHSRSLLPACFKSLIGTVPCGM